MRAPHTSSSFWARPGARRDSSRLSVTINSIIEYFSASDAGTKPPRVLQSPKSSSYSARSPTLAGACDVKKLYRRALRMRLPTRSTSWLLRRSLPEVAARSIALRMTSHESARGRRRAISQIGTDEYARRDATGAAHLSPVLRGDNVFLEDIRHACKNSITRPGRDDDRNRQGERKGGGRRDITRADFDGSEIPLDPSRPPFSRRAPRHRLGVCFLFFHR